MDTHIVVWLALEPQRLSQRAVQAMAEARSAGGLSIASCTLWEIALLHARKRINLDAALEEFLEKVETFYTVRPLTRQIAARGIRFVAPFPKDPADRQIGATAILHGSQLVTADQKILASGEVPCIW